MARTPPPRPLRICLAIDGSAAANRAAGKVIKLAGALATRPRLDVVSVDAPLQRAVAVSLGADAVARYHAENHHYYTRAAMAKLRRAGLEPELHLYLDAEPAAALQRHLGRHPSDLLVAGTHGRSALAAAVLGSVVTKLLSRTKVPLMVVR
jgi:nucleotide-binding universal stress UspA family protein